MTRKLFLIIGLLIFMLACRQVSKDDFTVALEEKLKFTIEKFERTNRAFILNVMTPTEDVIFQIVHRSYAKQTKHENDSFGFALQLTFPPNFRDMQAFEKFKTWKPSSDFIHYRYDGISCYIIDLGVDTFRVKVLTEKILIDLYNFKKTDPVKFKISDEGEVKNWL